MRGVPTAAHDSEAPARQRIAERDFSLALERRPRSQGPRANRFFERSRRELLTAVSGLALALGSALHALGSGDRLAVAAVMGVALVVRFNRIRLLRRWWL